MMFSSNSCLHLHYFVLEFSRLDLQVHVCGWHMCFQRALFKTTESQKKTLSFTKNQMKWLHSEYVFKYPEKGKLAEFWTLSFRTFNGNFLLATLCSRMTAVSKCYTKLQMIYCMHTALVHWFLIGGLLSLMSTLLMGFFLNALHCCYS